MRAFAAAAVALAAVAGLCPAAWAGVESALPGGNLVVVHAAAVTGSLSMSVDGVPSSLPVPFATALASRRVSAGSHTLLVAAPEGQVSGAVEVGSGCTVVIVVWRPGGPGRPLAFGAHPECPIAPAAPGRASVRLVVATDAAGPLTLGAGESSVSVNAGEASARVPLAAGSSTLALGRTTSPGTWRTVGVNAAAGEAYALVVAGDGDTPITTVTLDLGGSPSDLIPDGTRFVAGAPRARQRPWALPVIGAALVVAAIAAAALRQRRAFLVATALVLVAAGCGTRTAADPATVVGPAGPDAGGRVPTPALLPSPSAVPRRGGATAAPAHLSGPGVDALVEPVAIDELGILDQTLGAWVVGWVRGFAAPGNPGLALLVGHVDLRGSAVFGGLTELVPGATFRTTDASGAVTTWETEGRLLFAKGDPALITFLNSPSPVALLGLLTCTGEVVAGHHVDNLLVIAHITAEA